MRTYLLALCACVLLAARSRAQGPADEAPAPLPAMPGEHPAASPGRVAAFGNAPFLFVYVVGYTDNAAPRIVLGMEKPTLKISAFERCARFSRDSQGNQSLAVKLLPADAKTLVVAMKALGAPDAARLPNLYLWFATPEDRLLGAIVLGNTNMEDNIVRAGVLDFSFGDQSALIAYLTETLHLR